MDGKVRDALLQIEDEEGRLDPELVVERARDPESPLHAHFEWNDEEAAKQHRIKQARLLIRSVRVEVVVRDVPMSVVNYVRDAGGYQNIARVRSDADKSRATIIDELSRVVSAAKRARAVAAYLGTAEDINRIIDIANTVLGRVRPDIESSQGAA
jgi:hypothetical protein